MGRRTFSGMEVVKVLVNAGGFEWRRTTGDHAQLYYEHPTNEQDRRQVTVPLHSELRTGTLRSIAESAGAHDFDAFCAWIDEHS
ncbi:type II toxin-antitoxin system HicA family toxin [Haloferax volcanii]|uniref:Addiction module toxin, HicA family n=4 Tax=Haloferax TaxID=2251 RepID=A0A6C0UUM4_HALVO|nr:MULTISPECIES: type II toxin-antitoxin system HicA family toxin [Haloferax]ELZ75248.1 YcfA family protein [Haloferax lucentense DSM 14919]ELZ88001.1 YcfA family protein [Haloferax alexandrinus JCM 10717]NLV03719.1 addiction module toxin, HicA family [Haloferax alexandrinus]QIB79192.1 type II toxin-antitoxin system HicA family toxin [Haloferax alexandrinus]TVT95036.1 type II toxin-antitoxin system HicA family toxin [Haloferax volcanii]